MTLPPPRFTRNDTIVAPSVPPHKGAVILAIFLLGAGLGAPGGVVAQDGRAASVAGPLDVLTAGVAGAAVLAPRLLRFGPDTSGCAPCDRLRVPGVDRWAIAEPRSGLALASTGLQAALAVAVMLDVGAREGGMPYASATAQSGLVALGAAQILKEAAGRRRPELYTAGAVHVASDRDARRGFPSSHAAVAFALATSYWLALDRVSVEGRTTRRMGAVAAALGVGVLRVAAGRHFPTDVVAGAALGIAAAATVHTIKF